MYIFNWLVKNQFRESTRSILWQRNVATNIFFGIILFILILNLFSLGLFINKILDALYPGQDHVHIFNSWLLYYFLFDLILRYFLQKDPGLGIKPYLNLPVSRSKLIHFLLFRSSTSFLNLLPLLLILPFAIKIIVPQSGLAPALIWLAAIILFILCNSLFSFYFRRKSTGTLSIIIIFMIFIAGIIILDYFEVVSLRLYSALLFNLFLENILFLIIPVAGLFMIYRINFLFFQENLYLDKIAVRKSKKQSFGGRFNYLENFGETGEYLSLELKMLLRNKRTKSSFVMALMMLVIGPFFYFSMSDFWDPYPQPNPYTEILNDSEVKILFKINPDTIPANATVYITGNHEKLGNWGRGIGFIPLEMNKDGIWQRTISFPPKTELKYKFTLGTWKNERLDPDGSIPDAYVHEVESDTVLAYQASGWNVPRQFIFVDIMIVYMGLIFVGILMLIYGQFMLAWESNYFDFLLSRKIDFAKYFLAKYILLLVFGILMFLITTPIVFISKELLYVNAILTVYCLGVNSLVMFIMAGFTRKRLDLNASIFSTQGKGANQFTLIIPTMIIPLLIFVPFVVFDHRIEGYLFLLILGVLGLLFFRPLLKFCIRFFYKQKYKISSGFRQSRG